MDQNPITRYLISHDRGRRTGTPDACSSLARSTFEQVETTLVHDMMKVLHTSFFMKCVKPLASSK